MTSSARILKKYHRDNHTSREKNKKGKEIPGTRKSEVPLKEMAHSLAHGTTDMKQHAEVWLLHKAASRK